MGPNLKNQNKSEEQGKGSRTNSPAAADLVFTALRRMNRTFNNFSRVPAGSSELTGPQLLVLHEVRRDEGCTPGNIARRVHLSQPTVTVILDRLEAAGRVRRVRDASDKRRVGIHLTKGGRNAAISANHPLLDRLAREMDGLPREEQVRIAQATEQLAEFLDGIHDR